MPPPSRKSSKVVAASPGQPSPPSPASAELPIKDQKRVLSLLHSAFRSELSDPQFSAKLQHIKSLFYNRKFLELFRTPALLPIYSARYISYRTLAYLDLFHSVPILFEALCAPDCSVLAIGGGAGSEMASLLYGRFGFQPTSATGPSSCFTLNTVDIGDYSSVLTRLQDSFMTQLSIPASQLSSRFTLADVLDSKLDLRGVTDNVTMVTLFFTLNELFAQSKSGAVTFLQCLISSMPHGALLVLIDSAGSFTDITIGSRQYKMTVMLDMLRGLERLDGSDSQWFRVHADLHCAYPCKLENMRYFWRVYRVSKLAPIPPCP